MSRTLRPVPPADAIRVPGRSEVPVVRILGIPLARLDREDALAVICRIGDTGRPATIAYANAHTLNLASRDPAFTAVLLRATLILADGIGVAIAARLQRQRFPANLNGSDFNPHILALAARRGWPVFFLGARPGVADAAARRLEARIPDLRVVGVRDGYFPLEDSRAVARQIRASGAAVLMVALGNPLQEQWLDRHFGETGARLGVAVGAFLDFSAGVVRRAPAWMNRGGIEWLYRLGQEPRRLWRRYLVGNPEFLSRVARAWWDGRRRESHPEPRTPRRAGRSPDAATPSDRRIA